MSKPNTVWSKEQIYRFTSYLYKALETPEFILKLRKHKNLCGTWNADPFEGRREVSVDPRREILPTIIHEVIHDKYVGWTEKQVEKKERELMAKLSYVQMTNILLAGAKALKRCANKKLVLSHLRRAAHLPL
jgi:hypothetical protein